MLHRLFDSVDRDTRAGGHGGIPIGIGRHTSAEGFDVFRPLIVVVKPERLEVPDALILSGLFALREAIAGDLDEFGDLAVVAHGIRGYF